MARRNYDWLTENPLYRALDGRIPDGSPEQAAAHVMGRALTLAADDAKRASIEAEVARIADRAVADVARLAGGCGVPEAAVWDAVLGRLRTTAVARVGTEADARGVEVRLPEGGWLKRVTAVADRAKSGYDWEGAKLKDGGLVDLPAGALILWGTHDDAGMVDLGYVASDGRIEWWAYATKREWAVKLRGVARAYLKGGDERDAALALGLDQRRALESWREVRKTRSKDDPAAVEALAISDDLDARVYGFSA